jgi:hypothetical protein
MIDLGQSIQGMVLLNHVLCTNTNIVHPLWFARTIHVVCVGDMPKRQ